MGRKKGSKNVPKTNYAFSNSAGTNTYLKEHKIKKIIVQDKESQLIREAKQDDVSRVGRKKIVKGVLNLTDSLYITYDAHCWKLCKVNHKVNNNTGEFYPDISFLYANTLDSMLRVAAQHLINVPGDVQELSSQIDKVYKLIEQRIPQGVKPKDLFTFEEKEEE